MSNYFICFVILGLNRAIKRASKFVGSFHIFSLHSIQTIFNFNFIPYDQCGPFPSSSTFHKDSVDPNNVPKAVGVKNYGVPQGLCCSLCVYPIVMQRK